MKRSEQPKNTSTNTNTDSDSDLDISQAPVPGPSNPKRNRETESNDHLERLERLEQDIQTEGNEKETVEKLVEELVSLFQEKTEMEKTLQNEIEKLKRANEQQEAVISLLLLDEIKIEQRTEIKQLKSEIEELKDRLKFSFETTPPQNPEWPTKVLSRIFNYLDIASLKRSRLVCRGWKKEAGNILLKNFYIDCDDYRRDRGCDNLLQLLSWINKSSSTSTPKAQKLWSRDTNAEFTLQLLRQSKRLQSSITELIFSPHSSSMENLYEILQLLPNLQVLQINQLDLSPAQRWLNDDEFSPSGLRVRLELLIQKLQTMKTLKLDFWMRKHHVKQILCYHQQFSSIQSLEIHGAGLDFIRLFLENSLYNFSITRFNLSVRGYHKAGLIRGFLERISPTLKHLKFDVALLKNPPDASSSQTVEPWTDNFIIPLGLLRLETLEIGKFYGGKELVLKGILLALQLPRLKKLSVDFIPEELNEIIQTWNSHKSSNGRTLKTESLEELELFSWIAMTLNSRKIPRNPWPGLKSLKCKCEYSNSFDVSFLSELGNLERLNLNVSLDSTFHQNTTKKDEAEDVQNSTEFRLKDLKNLKGFNLQVIGTKQSCQDFINFLQEKELKFMKSLQCVELNFTEIGGPLR